MKFHFGDSCFMKLYLMIFFKINFVLLSRDFIHNKIEDFVHDVSFVIDD